VYTLLKSNGSHGSSLVGIGHEFSVMFSKAKDEARSQHKHLDDLGKGKNAIIDISSHTNGLLID